MAPHTSDRKGEMATLREARYLHSADAPLCDALSQQPGVNNFLVCTRPVHPSHTDHVCVGDDGSVLGSWSAHHPSIAAPTIAAHARAS